MAATSPVPPTPSPSAVLGIWDSLTKTGPDGVEPGLGTSEFWGKILVQGLGVLLVTGVISPAQAVALGNPRLDDLVAGILAVVVPEVVYAISRAIRKGGAKA